MPDPHNKLGDGASLAAYFLDAGNRMQCDADRSVRAIDEVKRRLWQRQQKSLTDPHESLFVEQGKRRHTDRESHYDRQDRSQVFRHLRKSGLDQRSLFDYAVRGRVDLHR